MDNILTYLDNLLEIFYQKNNTYPSTIIVTKETMNKIFSELDNGIDNLELSWADRKDNYKGIPIRIEKIEKLIRLE